MRHSLITALQDFAGAVIVVSHDRGLLRSVCDQFWLVADGVVRDFDGDLEDYAGWLEKRAGSATTPAAPRRARRADDERREQRRKDADARRDLAPKRQEIKSIETSLAKLGQERARLESELAGTRLCAQCRSRAQGDRAARGGAARSRAIGDTLARTIRAVRIRLMADEPDETPIDPSPPPAESATQLACRPHDLLWISRHLARRGVVESLQADARWHAGARRNGRHAAQPAALPHRRHRRGRVRRADRPPADLRCDAADHRRGAPVRRARLLPVQQPARRGRRRATAARAVGRAARRAAEAQARRCPACRSWSSTTRSTTCTAACLRATWPTLRGAGIDVVRRRSRRAARFESSSTRRFWRITTKWWSGDGRGDAWLPNPLDAGPGEGELRRLGAAAQLQGRPSQGADRRRRPRRHHRHRHLGESARRQQPAFERRAEAGRRRAAAPAGKRAGAGARVRLAQPAGNRRRWRRRRRSPIPPMPRTCRCSPREKSARPSCATSPARAPATASTSRCSTCRSAT